MRFDHITSLAVVAAATLSCIHAAATNPTTSPPPVKGGQGGALGSTPRGHASTDTRRGGGADATASDAMLELILFALERKWQLDFSRDEGFVMGGRDTFVVTVGMSAKTDVKLGAGSDEEAEDHGGLSGACV